MNNHKYKLKYKLDTSIGSFTKENVLKDQDYGATDALFVGSLIFPSDGSFSFTHFSEDGRNSGHPLKADDLFRVWLSLGSTINVMASASNAFDQGKAKIIKEAIEGYKKYING